jgi:hypothetical protein
MIENFRMVSGKKRRLPADSRRSCRSGVFPTSSHFAQVVHNGIHLALDS